MASASEDDKIALEPIKDESTEEDIMFPIAVPAPSPLTDSQVLNISTERVIMLNDVTVVCQEHIAKACSKLIEGLLQHDPSASPRIRLPSSNGVMVIALYLRTGLIPTPFINIKNFVDVYRNASYIIAPALKQYLHNLFQRIDNVKVLCLEAAFSPVNLPLEMLAELIPIRLPGALKHAVWRTTVHAWASHEPTDTKQQKCNWVRMLWSALDVIEETENTTIDGIRGREFVSIAEKRWKEGRQEFP